MGRSILAGRFQLEREVASGGMGTVYRARDLADGALVGIKLLRSEEIRDAERFAQEAAILAGLRHQGIVRYIAHGVVDGDRYLVMEWLDGEDLATRIDRQPLTLTESLDVVRRAAEAMAYAHEHGVVHRDIKPQNLFLPSGDIGALKVLDFGIARVVGGAIRKLTQTGTLVGTPGYLAPEIIEGRTIDGRADVFSLGCVAFECMAGRPLFRGFEPGVLLAKIMIEDPPDLREISPDVPPRVCDLVTRMLDKDVERRPTARTLLRSLQALGEVPDMPAAYARRRKTSKLTIVEQRVSCIIMAGAPTARAPEAGFGDPDANPTALILAPAELTPAQTALEAEIAETFQARLHPLPDGRIVITLPEGARATDQAVLAARCALAVHRHLPETAVVVAMGVARLARQSAVGAVIDSAARLLRVTARGMVRVDDSVASLVAGRFEMYREGAAAYLRRERDVFESRRSLLGKQITFVGRGQEISFMAGMLTDCVAEGKSGAVLLTGPAGIGKSRLLGEFLSWLNERPEQPEILFGAGDSLAAGAPFALLGRAIRRAAGIQDADPPADRRAKLEARVGRFVPAEARRWITVFLGEIASVPFPGDEDEALRAARSNPQLMADATRRAFEEWLRAESAAHPVLLVLEDLHWGDAGTVKLVDGALRALGEQPFLVLGLARPDLHAVFPNLWAERRVQAIQLAPLSRRSAEKMVQEALGPAAVAAPALVERIVTRGDGNPFYLEELIRAAHEGRVDALPEPVLGMIQSRLDAEGPEAKRVLRAASIFGERFSREGLSALLGGEQEARAVGDWLDRLTERELLARSPFSGSGAAPEFAFAHALVREAAYAMLTEEDRLLGHKLAGEWMEESGVGEPIVLAEHFWRAGEAARAAPWYRRAAEQALKANDLGGAVARANLGLAALSEADSAAPTADETQGALMLIQSEAHLWRGELDKAEERGRAALPLLTPGTALWFRAAQQVIVAAGKHGQMDVLERITGEVRASATLPGARDARVVCLSEAAGHLVVAGRYADADALLAEAVRLAEQGAPLDAQATALVHLARAARASVDGDPGRSLEDLEAALAAFEQAGDVRNACAVRSSVGAVYAELGDISRASEILRDAQEAATNLGLPEHAAVARRNLGRILGWRGEREEAERLLRAAIESFWAQGEPRLEGVARTYLAEVLLGSGAATEAERQAEMAVQMLAVAPALRVSGLAWLARARLEQGRIEGALRASREAHEAVETLGGAAEEGEATVRLVHAECLARKGLGDDARVVLSRARDRLLARSARLATPQHRRTFLEAVPANARTLGLAQTWCGEDGEGEGTRHQAPGSRSERNAG